MRELWRALRADRVQFLMIVLVEAVQSGFEALVHPLLLKAVFDQAILSRDYGRFVVLGVAYLAVGLTLNGASYLIAVWRRRFENSLVLRLELELLDRALSSDSREVSRAGNTSYVARVHNDIYEGVLPAIDNSVQVARHLLASVVFLGVLVYLSWQACLILLVIVPPLVYLSRRIARRIEENTEPEREAEAQYVGRVTETLQAFHALRGIPSLRPPTMAVNRGALTRFLDITFVTYRLNLKQRTLSDLIMNVSDTASMIVGAYFVFAGRLSFGGFLAFVNSLWRAVTGVFAVVNLIPQIRRSSAVLRRIAALRDHRAATYHTCGPVAMVREARVTFGDDQVVSIDHFYIDPGERVLMRGPNGCGKTTLLHILAGTLAPDAGTVELPRRVVCVSAPAQLPPLPVSDLVPDGDLSTALGLAGVAGQLPSELSSGQRQRVAIAALLSEEADLYLVDEPLANLDGPGRELVLDTLLARTRGRGLVVVHHGDEELDARFDRVVQLSQERPAEHVVRAAV